MANDSSIISDVKDFHQNDQRKKLIQNTTMKNKPNIRFNYLSIFLLLLLSIYTFLIISKGWVSSDGLAIIYQSYNAINGLGWIWNFGERTYVSTSPLFSIVSVPLTYILDLIFNTLNLPQNKIVFIPIIINLIFSVSAFVFMLGFIRDKIKTFDVYKIVLLTGIFGLLFASKFYIDFSTSGLENSLSYFVLTVFAILCINENTAKAKFFLPVVISLVFLTRYDFLVIVLPTALYYLYKKRITTGFIVMLCIIFGWFIFSFLYFGSVFPNSFYLKANNSSFYQSLYYFKRNIFESKSMFLLLAIGLYCSFIVNKRIFMGIILYLAYISIVRDYMFGRLFTPLLPLCIISAANFIATKNLGEYKMNFIRLSGFSLVVFIIIFYFPPVVNLYIPEVMKGRFFISNERDHYTRVHDFLNKDFVYIKPSQNTTFVNSSLTMLHEPLLTENKKAYFLDPVGLANPFVTYYVKNFGSQGSRPGHYVADIEALKQSGLYESVITQRNQIKNKKISELYNDVNSVSKGDIFDIQRIKKIIKLHTHNYK